MLVVQIRKGIYFQNTASPVAETEDHSMIINLLVITFLLSLILAFLDRKSVV